MALAYITGILPIKKIENESALNNFREYTMLDSKRLTQYYGFTEEEVKALCDRFDMDFESVRGWYKGQQQEKEIKEYDISKMAAMIQKGIHSGFCCGENI